MSAAERARATRAAGLVAPISRTRLIAWEAVGATVVLLVGSFLHFLYELSGYAPLGAVFGSVNESTWEHLKLFFWPSLGFAVVQHAYLRDRLPNIWPAAAMRLWTTLTGVALSFYLYVGIVLPIEGKGTLAGTIGTAIVGIVLGHVVAYGILTGPAWGRVGRTVAAIVILALTAAIVVFTFAPPRLFLFEDFMGYRYTGQFGILADYTNYKVFR